MGLASPTRWVVSSAPLPSLQRCHRCALQSGELPGLAAPDLPTSAATVETR